jgi:hypothetical protein
MDKSQEETIAALRTLFASVDTLQQIEIRDMLKPEIYFLYENALQDAYDCLTQVENALTRQGMKLEFQHWRLGGALEELTPLLSETHSFSDTIL